MNLLELLDSVHMGALPGVLRDLKNKSENEDYATVKDIISQFPVLLEDHKHFARVYKILTNLQTLENYIRLIEHPIHINEFKDKNGNIYLQARTSIKDNKGKTRWISAYVGSLNDYPKGVNDETALEKAKPLIRRKLKKYFDLK